MRRRRKGDGHNECPTSPGAAEVTATPCPVVDRDPVRDRRGGAARRLRQQQQQPSSSTSPSASATPTTAATWTPADLAAVTTDSSLKAMLPSSIVSANNLRVASDIPYPPWEYYVSRHQQAGRPASTTTSRRPSARRSASRRRSTRRPSTASSWRSRAASSDMIMSDMYDNAAAREAGLSFVDYAYDGTSILVPKGNPKGITNLTAWPARRSPARAAPRSRPSCRP